MGQVLHRLASGPTTKDRIELVRMGDNPDRAVHRVRVSWQGRQFDLPSSAFLGFAETMSTAARGLRAMHLRTLEETFQLLDRERILYVVLDLEGTLSGDASAGAWTLLVHGDHLDYFMDVLDARPSVAQARGIGIELDIANGSSVEGRHVVVLTPEIGSFPPEVAARVLGRRVRGSGTWWPHPADARLLWAHHVVCVRGAATSADRDRLDWLEKRGADGPSASGDDCTSVAVSTLRDAGIDLSDVTPVLGPALARSAEQLVASRGVVVDHQIHVDRLFDDPGADRYVRQLDGSTARPTFDFLSGLEGPWFPEVRHFETDGVTGWFEVRRVVGPTAADAARVVRRWTFDEARDALAGIFDMTAAIVDAGGTAGLVHDRSVQLFHARPMLAANATPDPTLPMPGSGVRHIIEARLAPCFPELLTVAKLIGKDPVPWAKLAAKTRSLAPRKADNARAQSLRLSALGRYGEAVEVLASLDDADRKRPDVAFWRSHIALVAGDARSNAPVAVDVDQLPPAIRRSDAICARVVDETIVATGAAPAWADRVLRAHLDREPSEDLVDLLARHGEVLPNLAASDAAEQAFRQVGRIDAWFGLVADLLVRESTGERTGLDESLRDRSGALLREVEHVSAVSALAQLAYLNDEPQRAMKLASAVLARDPYDVGCLRVLARLSDTPERWWIHVARMCPNDAEAKARVREMAWERLVPPSELGALDVSSLSARDVWTALGDAVRAKDPSTAHRYAQSLIEAVPSLANELTPLVDKLRHWDGAVRRRDATARLPRGEESQAVEDAA